LPGRILLFLVKPFNFMMSLRLTPSNLREISQRVSPFLTVYIRYSPEPDEVCLDVAEVDAVSEDEADEVLADETGSPFL